MKTIVRKIKTLGRVAIGKDFLAKIEVAHAKERFGSDYGGWDLVTKNIDNNTVVYSFGVGDDASFDIDLIKRFGLTVHAFDPTPKSIEWVKAQGFSDHFVMHEYGISAYDGNINFNPPENPNHVSHTVLGKPSTEVNALSLPVKRLPTIMEELGHKKIDIFKMDVEGAEYDVIKDISNTDIRPTQILIEFHHRFPGVGIDATKAAIETLRSIGYQLYAVSANNEEFCFIRSPG